MSRSKKYPVYKDGAHKYFKRLSNKKIRKWLKTLDNGFKSSKQFKHQVNSWDISDWRFIPRDLDDKEKAGRK